VIVIHRRLRLVREHHMELVIVKGNLLVYPIVGVDLRFSILKLPEINQVLQGKR